jgi:hypothetical protein
MTDVPDEPMISTPHPHHRRTTATAIVVLLCTLAAACASPAASHDALSAGAEPLRSHFNRDVGHTRIVLLAAPT